MGLNPTDPIFAEKIKRLDDVSKAAETSHRLIRLSLQLDDPETMNAFCYGRFVCASVSQSIVAVLSR
jgi:hypothetical protein